MNAEEFSQALYANNGEAPEGFVKVHNGGGKYSSKEVVYFSKELNQYFSVSYNRSGDYGYGKTLISEVEPFEVTTIQYKVKA